MKQQTLYSEGAVGSRQSGEETLNANTSGGGVGPGVGSGKNYQQTTSNESLLPSFEQQNVTYFPGRITSVTVALAVDKSVPAVMSLKQLKESIAAIVGPTALPEQIKLTVIDLAARGIDKAPVLQQAPSNKVFLGIFKVGSFKDTLLSIFSVIGTILGLLIIGIIGLNFLSSAVNQQAKTTLDESLGESFDDYEEDDDDNVDYGEKKALEQQEELLKEMLNDRAEESADTEAEPKEKAFSTATKAKPQQEADKVSNQKVEFESLLNNFQNAAQEKPDLLAKKIQLWLEDDEQ